MKVPWKLPKTKLFQTLSIDRSQDEQGTVIALKGRLDTDNADKFEDEVTSKIEGVQHLTMDLSELSFISSAGLRVFMQAAKNVAEAGGTFIVKGATDEVKAVFEMTGLDNVVEMK